MRYTLTILFISAILLCGNNRASSQQMEQPTTPKEWVRRAIQLTERLHRFASNEEAHKLFSENDEFLAVMKAMGQSASRVTLRRIRVMELSEDDIFSDLVLKMVSIDKTTWELVKDRFIPSAFASVINGQEGSIHLAACSVMNTTRTYTMSESWTHNLLFILDYGEYYATVVSFWLSGEDTVTGSATFMLSESEDAAWQALKSLSGSGSTYEEWNEEMIQGVE